MKPLKDLAELDHPRVDPKILLQFNTLIENVRIYASNHAPSWFFINHIEKEIVIVSSKFNFCLH